MWKKFGCVMFIVTAMLVSAQTRVSDNESSASDDVQAADMARFEVAAGVGWPGYHLYTARALLQYQSVGMTVEVSGTDVGPYFALSGQYYLPIDFPMYLSAGGGLWGDESVLFTNAGVQIPLGVDDNLRLTLEGGVSRVTVLDQVQVLPHVGVSIGYSFYFDVGQEEQRDTAITANTGTEIRTTDVQARVCNDEPTEESLESFFDNRATKYADKLYTLYSGTYTDLDYDYSIDDLSVSGTTGSVSASYSGSVVEVLTGKTISGGGSVRASFSWEYCSWHVEDYTYN